MNIRIAVLDLNNGYENQGIRCIRQIVQQWGQAHHYKVSYVEFDVRQKSEVPEDSYDIYISTGGPDSPLDSEGTQWEQKYFHWINTIEKWNDDIANYPKKHVFFICHSFQLACRFFKVAKVCKRVSTAFGVFPVHMLPGAKDEGIFTGLNDPFYAVDSRDYQVVEANHNRLEKNGGRILAIEKHRPHVPYERAIMAARFNDYFIGTQFHPEADAGGMRMYLLREDKKETVIKNHGEEKWKNMLEQLKDPEKITWTHNHILPNFLNMAVEQFVEN